MEKQTVLLGMSGGVDSSIAAYLLKKQGYNVIGAFLKLYSNTKNPRTGQCSYIEERKIAQKIASSLEIPLITLDFEKEYKSQVINPMYKAYSKNLTPNPDISCNSIIKFPILWKIAKKHHADFIATGHYARIKKEKSSFSLHSGLDKTKDQSYFLSELTQLDLSHTLFPIGSLNKDQVRDLAKRLKFPNWNKQGTRGICFVGKTDMRKFLSKKIPKKPGKIIDPEKNVIGSHPNATYYTIGQRLAPSVGISFLKSWNSQNKKWYVADKIKNTIIAAPENHKSLKSNQIKVKNIHLINPKEKILGKKLKARIRHLGSLHSGTLAKKGNNYIFKLKKPIEAITKGQYLVLYEGSKLLASAEIN